MPEQSSAQEKTEEATPRRLREARKKGQVARSRDLNTFVILAAAFFLVWAMINYMGDYIMASMKETFEIASKVNISDEEIVRYGQKSFYIYLKAILPYLGVITFIALAVGFVQTGPIFSAEPLKPKTSRLNMIENMKNWFKVTSLVELLKNVAKVIIIFTIAYMVIKDNLRETVLTASAALPQSTAVAGKLIAIFLAKVLIVFLVIAIVDLMVQRWQYRKQLRMTKEEVKREYKQEEGDPLIKSVRRQMHREFAMSDVREAVRTSDVVVTNPTELAIAIRYDEHEMMAPQITTKGQRLFAEMIKEIAQEYGVPVMENIPLAWALIELETGDEIPENLYAAMAEVLIIIYRMREQRKSL